MNPTNLPAPTKAYAENLAFKQEQLLSPLKDQAIALIMKAAIPNGLEVSDEGGMYAIDALGIVSWSNKQAPLAEFFCTEQVLTWASQAAKSMAMQELATSPTSPLQELGL